MGRRCGGCYACCVETIVKVDGLVKDSGIVCWNLSKESGTCKCYEERPSQCRSYSCLWLDGLGALETARPDQIGLIADLKTIEGNQYVCARELDANAWRSSAIGYIHLLADTFDFPILLKLRGSSNETGDWVIIKDALQSRCKALKGQFLLKCRQDLSVYELRIGNDCRV